MELGLQIQKTNAGVRISILNFQAKWTTLTFLAQICPKLDLGLEIPKTNAKIRLNGFEVPCVSIFRQNGQL